MLVYISRLARRARFMHVRQNSTVFALSSGQGKCGVAVIRVSGPNTALALKSLTCLKQNPQPRTAILRSIKHPVSREVLDKGLVLWFPGPNSFTGEDCCEFHVHGGIAVVNSILDALASVPDLQLAQPGQFTRRAFYNGKLDLTEVEGLADLLQAETELQRKQAFLQTQGALSKVYNTWKEVLVKAMAHVEAHIDFAETETIESGILVEVSQGLDRLIYEIEQHLKDGRKGEMLRSGVKAVILGEPNVGKSSFFNVLSKRPAAIVTPIEGTTRDILEVTLNIGGYPLVLADTAGLRSSTDDIIEREGISRALESSKNADLIILMIDTLKYLEWFEVHHSTDILLYLQTFINKLGLHALINKNFNGMDDIFVKPCTIVFNKLDLVKGKVDVTNREYINFISCHNENGVHNVVDKLKSQLKLLCGEPNAEHPSMNQIRHRQHLNNCLHNLSLSLNLSDKDIVLMAEYLRRALKSLGYLVGSTTTEDLLDVIFKDFCIGK